MIAPARLAAYAVLRAVNSGRADLPAALARAREPLRDERDRALAGEIATGTLRWQGAFDHVIAAYTKRDVARLDPEVLDVLRLTMFQLLHLDRVPASAAVNDAVDLTRKAGKKSAAPLVNAVLRRVSRERRRLPLPEKVPGTFPEKVPGTFSRRSGFPSGATRDAAVDYLSITLSHPRWLAARWLDRYGFEAAEAWCRFDNGPAALTLRANRLRTTPQALADALQTHGVRTRPGRFAPDALVVEDGNPLATPLAGTGLFVVQDEASQLVALTAGARPGQHVLDLCAAPGGKTTALAAAMGDSGLIVAADVRSKRIQLLARTVAVSGATSVRVVGADASAPLPFQPAFDLVLVDTPCSGLGTLRRDPDIRWRVREDQLPNLAAVQRTILERAAAAVRPGGRLVYATCSSEPEENDDVVRAFLEAHPEFSPARTAGPDGEIPDLIPGGPLLTPEGFLRTLPFRDSLEAFFAAPLVKARNLR
jgi:16S rRNA (cytosine967-C5)-methyltransferase